MFDNDGVTANGVLYLYLRNFTTNIKYVFHQRNDGHGVIPDNVPFDCDLLIIVDSSTNSVEECKELKERCDVIVLDHHSQEFENPYATIVNSTTHGYPNKHLSGSAIAYKFCKAMDEKMDCDIADDYLDLASIGLIGDMMRLDQLENRYIVEKGLELIKQRQGNLGIRLLFDKLLKQAEPTSESISFYISPCINSVIRLDNIYLIFELLICEYEDDANEIIDKVIDINEKRKSVSDDIFKYMQSNDMIDLSNKIIVIDMTDSGYDRNIYGLVANKVMKEYNKPCLFGAVYDGIFRGSARCPSEGINFRADLNNSGLFKGNFGHSLAFGSSFDINNKQKIFDFFNEKYKNNFIDKFYYYDMKLPKSSMTIEMLDEIDSLSKITGVGFEKPKFLVENIRITKAEKIGENKNHTKLTQNGDIPLNIMKFNTEEKTMKYLRATTISVIGSVAMNRYNGYNKVYESKQIISDLIVCN